jgi:hypothetical protein
MELNLRNIFWVHKTPLPIPVMSQINPVYFKILPSIN